MNKNDSNINLDILNKLSNNSYINKSSNSNLIEENNDTHLKDISSKQKGKEIANKWRKFTKYYFNWKRRLKYILNSNNLNDVNKKTKNQISLM